MTFHSKLQSDASRWPEEVVVPSLPVVERCARIHGRMLKTVVPPTNFLLSLPCITSPAHPFITLLPFSVLHHHQIHLFDAAQGRIQAFIPEDF